MGKRELILAINPCIHGLNYHDPSIALISNGEILYAIEEERLTGIKGIKGVFPIQAIKECLKCCKIQGKDITGIAVGYEPTQWNKRLGLELGLIVRNNIKKIDSNYSIKEEDIIKEIKVSDLVERYQFFNNKNVIKNLIIKNCSNNINKNINIKFYEHHLAHIASSYELSGIREATGVVIDGIGEIATVTIWKISNQKYEKVMQINYPNSLGYFYAIATRFLGFEPWKQEGKTMALAGYGRKDEKIYSKLMNIVNAEKELYDVSDFMEKISTTFLMVDETKAIHEIEKQIGISARKEGEPITQQHINFAWAVQNILEQSVVKLINYAIGYTGIPYVCAAGGIFMNCKMNMVIRENSIAKEFFVQPVAGDAGTVFGAGLLMSQKHNRKVLSTLALGTRYSDKEIERYIIEKKIHFIKIDNIAKKTAELIAGGKVVAWFQGRGEIGARALGKRSILADPRNAKIADYINAEIKHREIWRPFACSVQEEEFEKIFKNTKTKKRYPFMIEAFEVKELWVNRIPAVIHKADHTSRPQTVNKEDDPLYYGLIENFKKITGCPLILNTSLNDRGQPLIMDPQKAIEFFLNSKLDVLVIEDYLLMK